MTTQKGRNFLSVGIKRTALSLALGACFVGAVQAQSAVGSIFGDTKAGSTVTIQSGQTGVTRTITSDATGRFTFGQLPPGSYKVTSDGVTRDVVVKVGTGSPVSFAAAASGSATTLDTVLVTGSGAINPIDVSSVESTTVFTAEQINALPVAQNITAVALLAPGTVKGDSGIGNGNLASFGGSSVAENGYYINGFDVTNIRNFISYADLPFQAIAQQQVKTGGYGAEYGRSLGGVINLVTKRGSNEWHYGGGVFYQPSWGRDSGKDVITRSQSALENGDIYSAYRSDNEYESLNYNAYASGPLIKDRLFFFALVEGRGDQDDVYGTETSYRDRNNSPTGMLKLDWYITDDHLLEFTGIYNKTKTKRTTYSYSSGKYVGVHQDKNSDLEFENGGKVGILKYTGYLTDNFTLSAQAGYLKSTDNYQTPEGLPGSECVRAFDSRVSAGTTTYIGCWNTDQTFIRDADFGPDEDERKAYRLDAEWQLGDHRLRFGYDTETFTSSHAGQTYTGGAYWRHFRTGAAETRQVNGVAIGPNTNYARRWDSRTTSAAYDVENVAYYVEDSWQVTDNFMAYLGLRSEQFENKNAAGVAFVKSDHEIAPRLGFAWDVNGDSTFKVFGNAGRYYIPVAANTNIRASGGEVIIEDYFLSTGVDVATGLPVGLGAQIGPTNVNGTLDPPNPASIATTNLKPMYQDEFILGGQIALNDSWTVGLRAIMREVKSGMDDYCSHQPFLSWAEDNNKPDIDLDSIPGCFIMNPGSDVSLAFDSDGDGVVEVNNISSSYFGLPKYRRKYSAMEFFWEGSGGDKWYVQGSYTYAKSKGNVEGYVNSTLEQDDAGLTQDFDHKLFEDGSFGYLPNDRRHTVKMFGTYRITDEWRIGGNLLIQSGRPVNCQGFIPLDDPSVGIDAGNLALYSGSSFYCLKPDGVTRELSRRGEFGRTPWIWTFDASVAYTPNWADKRLTLQVDVFNLFNRQQVTEYSEGTESSRGIYNPNFLNDLNYQAPRQLRFSVRYDY
ncbi:TonB-dependent receptor [Pseudoxanthomonas sp. 22568]|uniref:TonB-dependent receptor n=1 Tax=Pseudoxanthomonas sp. 22568 TaxID=3453945 RepID=UPI00296F22B0|nr:TonB-dependent receptor [Pseudoxanthomonas japonensis]